MRLIRRERTGSNARRMSGCINAACNGPILSRASSSDETTSGALKRTNKATSARNAYKGGERDRIRALAKLLRSLAVD